MPQYSNSVTSSQGAVVNAVYNTEANTITYTVTGTSGLSTSVTLPPDKDPQSGVTTINSIRNQLAAQNGGSYLNLGIGGFGQALGATWGNVNLEAKQAEATAVATGTPVPAEPSPPAPVATPAAAPEPVVENPAPEPVDEFAGIDQQVANNENALQEPPLLSDEEVNDYFDQQQNEQVESDNTVLDDGSDPYFSNGESTIEQVESDSTVIDDGSDPYVSNGNTTVEQVESSSTVIDDGSDPYVSNGQSTVPTVGSENPGSSRAIGIAKSGAQSTATKQDSASFQKAKDWRVRISLAPGAKYLYKGVSKTEAGILAPLQDTDGVIFPYTPNISVSYAAGYDATDIAHSNYKVYQYKGSSVDNVTITGDFTAQDTTEANYMLAVIHFFRSVTKMFYGQDQNPKNGVPPPLCYLSGFGSYQFDNHPLAITNFTYTTPTDVDYIRAGSQTNMPGQNVSQQSSVLNTIASAASAIRLLSSNLTVKAPNFQAQNSAINSDATYVPTKISIAITAVPVVSRNDISNTFSLKKYGTGELLKGSTRNGGGIW